ncbi:Mitogen-activated protein kinase kinase kinase 7 [Sparganum proliferum]
MAPGDKKKKQNAELLLTARFNKRCDAPFQTKYTMSHAFLWFLHAANALEYLHEHCSPTKIHRDIKPANMLLFDDCRLLKLCDFGTAREEDEDVTLHQGSIKYMAPEVLAPRTSERPKRYDRSADIYSLCASFWEVFTRSDYSKTFQPIEGCPKIVQDLLKRGLDKEEGRRPKITDIVRFVQFVVDNISALPPTKCNLQFPPDASDEEDCTVSSTTTSFYDSQEYSCVTSSIYKSDDDDDAKTLIPTQKEETPDVLPTPFQDKLTSQISCNSCVSDCHTMDGYSGYRSLEQEAFWESVWRPRTCSPSPLIVQPPTTPTCHRYFSQKTFKTSAGRAISPYPNTRAFNVFHLTMTSAGWKPGVLEPPNEFAGRWTPEQRHMRKPVDLGFRSQTPEPLLYIKFEDFEGIPEVSTTTSSQATTAALAPPIPPKPAPHPSISVQDRRAWHRPLPPKSPMSSPDAYANRRPSSAKSTLSSPDANSDRRPLPEKSPASSHSTGSSRRPLPSKSPMSSPDTYSDRRPLPEKSPLSSPDASSNRRPLPKKSLTSPPPLPPKENGVSSSPMNTTSNGRGSSQAPALPPKDFVKVFGSYASLPEGEVLKVERDNKPPALPPRDCDERFQSYASLPDGEVFKAGKNRKLKFPCLPRKGHFVDEDFPLAGWEAKEEREEKRHHNRGFSK